MSKLQQPDFSKIFAELFGSKPRRVTYHLRLEVPSLMIDGVCHPYMAEHEPLVLALEGEAREAAEELLRYLEAWRP